MPSYSAWISATRPKTLAASVAPVAMGSAIAAGEGAFAWGSAAACLSGALGVQVACNFANDCFDAKQGADTEARVGPKRAVASGEITPKAMLVGAWFVLLLVVAPSAAYLAMRAGWRYLVLAVAATLLAFAYTWGRHSIAYLGLGELFVLLFFGSVAVGATYTAQTLHWSWVPVIVGIGPGLLACAILTVNNLRDIEADRAAGKRTLAVRFGPRFARAEYVVCVVGAGLLVMGLAVWHRHLAIAAAVFAPLTLVGPMRRVMAGESGPSLNGILAQTGIALLLYGALFCVGWIR